jgi:glucuronate isomerase
VVIVLLNKDFLLDSTWGKKLFHEFAENEPIIDYHCHLEPKDLLENKKYSNLTQVWLNDNGIGDHYKWRLLRTNGVEEELVSGNGDDYEKFLAFVKAVEKAPGNPIYEWSHLELRRYFNIDLTISEKNAPEIWRLANEKLQLDDYRPKQLLEMMKVKAICTTDDPIDDLSIHQKLAKENNSFKVLPTFRADNTWGINNKGFKKYILNLENITNIQITTFKDFKTALSKRVDYFHDNGGRLADQGLNTYKFVNATESELDDILSDAINGEYTFTENQIAKFTTAVQLHLMDCYHQHNWTMQVHMNVLRNDSSKLKREVGINVGGDSMGDQSEITTNIVALFSEAEERDVLPKVILYSLNPNDWLPLSSAMQSFQGGMIQKLQLGCAWWFNDTCEGMRNQLTTMAQQSLLANFTGMLTDSRSFLSYPRHEYFRRVLCQLLGEWVDQGRLPEDEEYLGGIVRDICYGNAHSYFGFF